MGSKLLSTDMLLSEYILPMRKAASFHDYVTAASCLFELNSFLVGFGETGLTDIPEPPKVKLEPDRNHMRLRVNASQTMASESYRYYTKYSPLIAKALGRYQDVLLKAIASQDRF